MADPGFLFQEWCRKHRTVLEKELVALKAGKVRVYRQRGTEPVDETEDAIRRLEKCLAELNDLLFDT